MMTPTYLENRQSAIEQRFNELTQNKAEIEDELKRLQGEHRLLQDLKNYASEPDYTSPSPPEEVADAEPVTKRIRKEKVDINAED